MSVFPPWLQIIDRNGIVVRALSATVDRTESDGCAWCPPRVAASLVDLVVERDASLSNALQGAVRFVRLLQLIDGRHYWAPLYRGKIEPYGIPQLTSLAFRTLVTRAADAERIDPAVATVTPTGVTFLEPELSTRVGSVVQMTTLSYGAMPVLAGLLTTLHEALGLNVVAEHIQPLLAPGRPTRPAFEIANELARTFDRWLTGNLDTAHHMRQARAMRSFLALHDLYDPALVDDAAILEFWQEQARRQVDADLDGFRLFKSAARKMILYRDQLRSVAAMDGLSAPVDITTVSPAALTVMAVRELDEFERPWVSPLAALALAPVNRIKWLTSTEQKQVTNFFGEVAHPELATDGIASDKTGQRNTVAGALPSLRYDLSLWRTLLRVDVFGDVQAKITQMLRDVGHIDGAIDAKLSAVPATAYSDVLATYRAIRAQVRLAMLASLDVLASHGVAVAGLLVESVADAAAHEELRRLVGALVGPTPSGGDDVHGRDRSDPSSDLLARIDDLVGRTLQQASQSSDARTPTALGALMVEAKKARKSIRRSGFGAEADGLIESFTAAVEPLTRLHFELDRLVAALEKAGRVDTLESDRLKFLETFQVLYGAAGDRGGAIKF